MRYEEREGGSEEGEQENKDSVMREWEVSGETKAGKII